MALEINASDHGAGGGGGIIALDAGTYSCTLKAANMYLNNKYQSEELVKQITLIWDTGLTAENDKGEEVDVVIFDSFINFSFNEKAKLTERLTALGLTITPKSKIGLNLDGINSLDQLQRFTDTRTTVNDLTIDGQTIFNREALISITINDKGYPKVTNAAAPIKAPSSTKLKTRQTTDAPAGIPT